jgi:molybdate transport system regulatory protein
MRYPLMKFDVDHLFEMSSLFITESIEAIGSKLGEKIQLIIKAIHVLPVREYT